MNSDLTPEKTFILPPAIYGMAKMGISKTHYNELLAKIAELEQLLWRIQPILNAGSEIAFVAERLIGSVHANKDKPLASLPPTDVQYLHGILKDISACISGHDGIVFDDIAELLAKSRAPIETTAPPKASHDREPPHCPTCECGVAGVSPELRGNCGCERACAAEIGYRSKMHSETICSKTGKRIGDETVDCQCENCSGFGYTIWYDKIEAEIQQQCENCNGTGRVITMEQVQSETEGYKESTPHYSCSMPSCPGNHPSKYILCVSTETGDR